MTESEAIKETRFNMSTIGLSDKAAKRVVEARDMAINELEKQIPKKVKIEQWIYTKCDCGYEFSKHHGDGYYSIPLENKTKYCPNCGQKLNWESDEE